MTENANSNTKSDQDAVVGHSPAATSNNQKTRIPQDASCRSCVALVREILMNPTSRPRQVLEALVLGGMKHDDKKSPLEQPSFTLKPIDEGVQVEMRIPDEPWTLLRPWKNLDPLPSSSSHEFSIMSEALRTTTPVLATSSSTSRAATSLMTPPNYVTETIKIECRPCDTTGPEQGARALIMGPNPLSIVACTNRLAVHDRDEMSQVLVHELVHAYDVKRLRLDFSDCESMAYSEVRAAREAECFSSSTSAVPGPFHFLKEYCVKQKAIAATHNLFPSPQGRNCVRAVFATAFKDPRPFSPEEVREFVQRNQTNHHNTNNYPSRSHNNNHNNNPPNKMSNKSQK